MQRILNDESYIIKGMWASMACWGFSWVSNKVLASYGGTDAIVLFRILLTCFSMALLLPLIKEGFRYPWRGAGTLLLASATMTLYFFLFIGGLREGLAGAGGVLVTTLNPIVTFALTALLQRALPTRREAIGLALGAVAGFLLLRAWDRWDQIFAQGNAYFLAATLVWAILSRLTAASRKHGSSLAFSFWMYVASSALTLALSDRQEALRVLSEADAVFWGNLFFSATITTTLATTYYFLATAKIGVNRSSAFLFLVPSSAMLGAWIFVGEVPQWHTVAGGALGVLAVYVINRK